MIRAAVKDALESTLIIKVQLCLTNPHNHFTVLCSVRKGYCVSDLYCVHLLGKEGLGPVRGGFPINGVGSGRGGAGAPITL